jgi:3-isopropylmalate/(R)-2-methylmalate dehydratase small subunit
MEPFTTHRGRLALLDWTDVNTDLIMPARYLKKIERTGFGPLLFADKRYVAGAAPEADTPDQHGAEQPEFPLNSPAFQGATILLVGQNFGCGSSREHAVWGVAQAGYRAVIAPGKGVGFADIFEANAFQNGLLVIELDEADWQVLATAVRENRGIAEATVDLEAQTITLHRAGGTEAGSPAATLRFAVPEVHRRRLLNGLDSIGETMLHEPAIARYEAQASPWLSGRLVSA